MPNRNNKSRSDSLAIALDASSAKAPSMISRFYSQRLLCLEIPFPAKQEFYLRRFPESKYDELELASTGLFGEYGQLLELQ